MSGKRVTLVVVLAAIVAAVYLFFFSVPPGPRSLTGFDPDQTADLEVDMWKGYYDHNTPRLFVDLVRMLHEQYRYPWYQASWAAYYFARAASTFADSHTGYELLVPDLQAGYQIGKDWTHASFDPAAVARAELAWWIARRIASQNSPEIVGGLIADEDALLFGVPREKVLVAGVLRARAGRLRDDGGDNADWNGVSDLLHQSYRQLYAAVSH